MIRILLLCLSLVISTTILHYEVLSYLSKLFSRNSLSGRMKVLSLMLVLPFLHLLEMAAYAAAYYLVRDEFFLGTLTGNFTDSFFTYLYFSVETYTSLGFGDIIPQGASRLLVGLEALNGLLLIGWSGSYVFLVMQKEWHLE